LASGRLSEEEEEELDDSLEDSSERTAEALRFREDEPFFADAARGIMENRVEYDKT
jgi:anti-sigma factor RsiW